MDSKERKGSAKKSKARVKSFEKEKEQVSQDRYFLDRLCTHILAFEGDGRVEFFEGTWSEYLRNAKNSIHATDDSAEGKSRRFRPLNYF